jgi:2-dehydro-3-deoxyglucarate aldolase/4-hydroxy-2-oxoheptanedioate aldolase
MENAAKFRARLRHGPVCLGTVITLVDATVTEALCGALDFLWIDTEHGALSLETVQSHLMAAKGSGTPMLVRVPWNDPVLVKPVLDIGADGVIVPLVRTAADVQQAVAACRYPPDGIRGFGPRRPSNYGRLGGPEFCRMANESVLTFVQIEHRDALDNLREILQVPGLAGVLVGPNDLAGSLGLMGQPEHPDVLLAIDSVFQMANDAGVPAGIAVGLHSDQLARWISRGARWLTLGTDTMLMLESALAQVRQIRSASSPEKPE